MSASGSSGDPSGSRGEARDDTAGFPGQDSHVDAASVDAASVDAASVDATRVEVSRVDLAKLERLAGAMVRSLPSGLTFALVGTLGAGKTRLTQAIAGALGIERAEVTSPTFTLVQSHDVGGSAVGVRTLHHLDAYRLCDEDEFLDLGVEELFADAAAWTIVEWADRVADAMPSDAVWVSIELESLAESRLAGETEGGETEGGETVDGETVDGGERRRIVFRTDDIGRRGVLHELARAITHGPEADRSKTVVTDAPVDDRSDPPCDGAESP